jgi:uncharacterized membrane protein YhaH (DUF805 family)
MSGIIASIVYGFGNVLGFSGRDARGRFWPYAIFIFLAASLISYVAMIPELMRMMQGSIEVISQRTPGAPASPEEIDAIARELMPNFEFMMLVTLIVDVVAAALLAAAVARRLHDRDRRGYWGLLPLPSFALGFALAPELLSGLSFQPAVPRDMTLVMWASLNSVFMWGLLIFVVVLLAGEGTSGPNRFGPPPEPAAP